MLPTWQVHSMKLSDYLKKEKMSASEFAELVGVDKSTISRILRGKRYPRRATVEAIRKATDNRVTVADLYYTEAT